VNKESAESLEKKAEDSAKQAQPAKPAKPAKPGAEPTIVGKGWTSVLVAKLPTDATEAKGTEANQLEGLINGLPKVSGTWGSGRLLSGSLFSALLTDDGRVLVGAVAPEKLYEAAGK
jgi:hypothetical protein